MSTVFKVNIRLWPKVDAKLYKLCWMTQLLTNIGFLKMCLISVGVSVSLHSSQVHVHRRNKLCLLERWVRFDWFSDSDPVIIVSRSQQSCLVISACSTTSDYLAVLQVPIHLTARSPQVTTTTPHSPKLEISQKSTLLFERWLKW